MVLQYSKEELKRLVNALDYVFYNDPNSDQYYVDDLFGEIERVQERKSEMVNRITFEGFDAGDPKLVLYTSNGDVLLELQITKKYAAKLSTFFNRVEEAPASPFSDSDGVTRSIQGDYWSN